MLIPFAIACYLRFRAGIKGKGEETLADELEKLGYTVFLCYVIWAIIEFLI
jgi:hypothetical protein